MAICDGCGFAAALDAGAWARLHAIAEQVDIERENFTLRCTLPIYGVTPRRTDRSRCETSQWQLEWLYFATLVN